MTRTSHLPLRALRKPSRLLRLSALGLSAACLSGCVSQEKYNAMKIARDQAVEQLGSAQSQANTAMGQYEVLKHQLEAIRGSGDNQAALAANQAQTIADLQHQLEDVNARYKGAVDLAGRAGTTPLPIPLTNELTALAEQNPGLVDFDSARGLIKFKSDVTFPAGSAEVSPAAKPVIDKVAQILNGPTAGQYDLVVVGHTDNTPVSNPATIRAGNKDNWFLSAHRAISVGNELQRQGVNSGRIQVSGYADQRPAAPNDSDANKAKNRRVEVLILPTQGHASVAAAAPSGAVPAGAPLAGRPAPKPATGLNKDANKDAPIEPDRRPRLDK